MWLTSIAIRRPIVVWTAFAAIVVLGLISYARLPAELNPRVDIPTLTVITVYPGASPIEVEDEVTTPMEEAVGSVGGVRNVYSSSQESVSIVGLDLQVGTDTDKAVAAARDRAEALRASLPADVRPSSVAKLDINAQPVLYAAVTGGSSVRALRRAVDDALKPSLMRVAGVAGVTVAGGEQREVRVLADPRRLASYGLTVQDVVNAVRGGGRDVPAGSTTEAGREIGVRAISEFGSVEDIAASPVLSLQLLAASFMPQLPIPGLPNASTTPHPVTVGELADAVVAPKRAEVLTRTDGEPSVALVIAKAPDANAIAVADEAKAVIRRVQRESLPAGSRVAIARDESTFVRDALHDVNVTLILGALLATGVVLLFLRDLRGTAIVALALPACILATYVVMYFAGFTLNQMTLLALSLSVGILVDDSIVVLESINRHRGMGEPADEAAFNGRTEIGFAGIALTLTDVVVFVPIAFMGGIVGAFFREFGLTVAFATLFSLLVSFTVTPMLAARWYRRQSRVESRVSRGPAGGSVGHAYRRILGAALQRPWWVIGWSSTALVAVILVTVPVLGFEFLPASDQGQVSVVVETAPGTSLSSTDAITRKVEPRLSRFDDVAHMMTTVGEVIGGFGAIPQRGPQFAQINIRLRERLRPADRLRIVGLASGRRRALSDQTLATAMRAAVADVTDARVTVSPVRTVANVGPDVQIELRADPRRHRGNAGLTTLAATADAIRRRLRDVEGVLQPDTSIRTGQPEMHVEIDRIRAAAADVPPAVAGAILRDAVEGADAGKVEYMGETLPIRVSLADVDRSDPGALWQVPVGYSGSRPVLLGEISRMAWRSGPAAVERINGQRSATVTAALAPGYALGNVRAAIERQIARDIPEGIEARFGGESGVMDENIPHFALAIALAIVLVFLVTAALFNSVIHPLLMMLALPMALTGGLGALALCGETLSLVSAIGVIMLTGLMGRNAILLMDYTNTLRARGVPVLEAVTEAGATRLRPILMTTLATIFGMLPVALRMGRAAELRAPMAIVVIGGLLVSTILTLVVIPAAYALVSGWAQGTAPAAPATGRASH